MTARLTLISLVARAVLRSGRKRLIRKLVFLALAAATGFLALAAGLVALGIWLSTLVGPAVAALLVALGLAVLALTFALLARGRKEPPVADRLADEVNRMTGAVEAEIRRRPLGWPLLAAGGGGMILGLRLFGRR